MIEHDAKPGPLTRCQITGSENLFEIIDLGHQPLCDALRTKEQLQQPETRYPLRLMLCPESGLAQLDYVVDGREVYPHTYPYRCGISKPVVEYQQAFADAVRGRFNLFHQHPFVVDIGSNDGTLLAAFKRNGSRVLGIEPTGIAQLANDAGVETLQRFFTEALARDIVHTHGRARLITMTNVFAHMADLGEVMRGIDLLLAREAALIIENHYLGDIHKLTQFDTIYHEHIRTYSCKALSLLADQYGMEVFDVELVSRYGGNIRAFIGRKGQHHVSDSVANLIREEEVSGLFHPTTWAVWRERVYHEREGFMRWLIRAARHGRIGGVSCPGRAATLINFYGITKDQVPYMAELPTSLKLGKYLPGAHIPVIDNKVLREDPPEYAILFSWHYATEIRERLNREGVPSKMVQPLPRFSLWT